MSIAILLVAHEPVAGALVRTARTIFNAELQNFAYYDMPLDQDRDLTYQNLCTLRDGMDCSGGLLILTDLCGATPHNVARRLMGDTPSVLVSGLNLPMVLRIFGDERKDLTQMARNFTMNGHMSIFADSGEEA